MKKNKKNEAKSSYQTSLCPVKYPDGTVKIERINVIEQFFQWNSWHLISPYPTQYKTGDAIFDLEIYLEKHFLKQYADKVSMIVLKLICLYEAEVSLSEFYEEDRNHKFAKYALQDIRHWKLKKIAKVISYVINETTATLNVYFPDQNSLISIDSDISTVIYSTHEEFLQNAKIVTEMEGLILMYVGEDEQKELTEG